VMMLLGLGVLATIGWLAVLFIESIRDRNR
jgi:hypothetical protein